MNKQKILQLTGLSEDDFYNNYPDQQTFCADYPDACHELSKAQNGMEQNNVSYEVPPSGWQIIDGEWKRPRTISAQGNSLVPVRPVIDPVHNNAPTPNWQVADGMWSRPGMPNQVNKRPTMKPMSPVGTQYNFPKIPLQSNIERLSAKQTMNKVGSTGAPIVSSPTTPVAPIPMQNTMAAVTSKYTPPVQQATSTIPSHVTSTPTPTYNTNSVVDTMKAQNIDSSFASRKKLAIQNGITDYKGTASQNIALNKIIAPPTYKAGGYYGMDQKFHPNNDSGTYVSGAGYYFDTGGQEGQFQISDNQSRDPLTSDVPPGQTGAMDLNQDNQPSPFEYGNPQPQRPAPFSLDPYSSVINPATGFKDWSKDGKVINNIKRDDADLWNNLKEKGHGARWETGQTDFQKVGRVAGQIGNVLDNGINVAGAIGNFINNAHQQKYMDNSAINMGSTTSMFTNPSGSGKGDYGVTGTTYGQFKPNQSGNFSYKGMYGKFGMEIPKLGVGGFEPQFETLSGNSSNINPSIEMPIMDMSKLYAPPVIVGRDNTRVIKTPTNIQQHYTESNDNDSNLKDLISKVESHGDYKALPWKDKAHTKLASSAAGKYQFLWGDHKNHIAEVTGITTKQDFLNNPAAQEKYFDYWDKTTLTPMANKIKSKLHVSLPLNKIKAAVHQAGAQGAWDYFSKGKQSVDAFGMNTGRYVSKFQTGGSYQKDQVLEMDEDEVQQFLANGGQLEFLD